MTTRYATTAKTTVDARATSVERRDRDRRQARRPSSSSLGGPTSDPVVFNSNDDAKLALQNGQVDAIVTDLPTAFFITAVELDDGVIVGQLETGDDVGDQFGLLLEKDSPLTDCVSRAVDALRDNGTLADLEKQWLSDVADAPVLS